MTADELRALDAEIHRKVFGKNSIFDIGDLWDCGESHGFGDESEPVPHYSTDIAAAWQVLEWLKRNECEPLIDCGESHDRWHVQCEFEVYVTEATAPLAICRAALKALESM